MVEQWSPKPKVKGSNPFSPEYACNSIGESVRLRIWKLRVQIFPGMGLITQLVRVYA